MRSPADDALSHLLEVPAGITRADLRFDPMWNPLRNDPRFAKLWQDRRNKRKYFVFTELKDAVSLTMLCQKGSDPSVQPRRNQLFFRGVRARRGNERLSVWLLRQFETRMPL
jgi:hypothetical protein